MASVSVIILQNGKRTVYEVDEDVLQGLISNLEGGSSNTVYLNTQCVDGGDSDGS